jgi:YidC/Oxa1 family membrane protein insertase
VNETEAPRPPSTPFFLAAGALLLVTFGLQAYFAPEPPAPPEETPPSEDAEAAVRSAEERARLVAEHTVEPVPLRGDGFEAAVDNIGGGLASLRLTGDRYHLEDGGGLELVTTSLPSTRPLRVELEGTTFEPVWWDVTVESESSVLLRAESDGLVVERRFRAGDGPFQIVQEVRVRNAATYPRAVRLDVHAYQYVTREEEGGGMFSARSTHIASGLCRHDGETTRKEREALLDAHGYAGNVDFVGIENAYFAQMLAPMDDVDAERCGLHTEDRFEPGTTEAHGGLFDAELRYPVVTLPAGGEHAWRVLSYFGPKDWSALEVAGHELTEVVNLGTLAVIARQFARLLGWLHGWTGNWGLAIILLTILVRIALYPLVERQFRAMAPMRKLKPELDELNKKYADDLEKRQAAMMALYQRHGINPLSQMFGCLPLLLQMPVFFALYTSLSTNVELYHQPFALWWRDLSAPDPYFVLPLLLVGLMHLQQRMTPAAMDPQQQKIMMVVMPVMMGLFMLFLPSGLCLYMMTNSVLGMGQQQLNQWRTAREEATRAAAAPETTEPAKPAADTTSEPPGRSSKRRPSRG